MRLDGAFAEVTATCVRKAEVVEYVEEWSHEHDDGTSATSSLEVERLEV